MMAMFSEMDPVASRHFGAVYPEEDAIKVGSAWEHPVKMQGMVTGEIPFKYEVVSFNLDGKKTTRSKSLLLASSESIFLPWAQAQATLMLRSKASCGSMLRMVSLRSQK
ncbi:MAG: hypothetical protein R2688_10445 [Fimbriimonadaceae bacterium]